MEGSKNGVTNEPCQDRPLGMRCGAQKKKARRVDVPKLQLQMHESLDMTYQSILGTGDECANWGYYEHKRGHRWHLEHCLNCYKNE